MENEEKKVKTTKSVAAKKSEPKKVATKKTTVKKAETEKKEETKVIAKKAPAKKTVSATKAKTTETKKMVKPKIEKETKTLDKPKKAPAKKVETEKKKVSKATAKKAPAKKTVSATKVKNTESKKTVKTKTEQEVKVIEKIEPKEEKKVEVVTEEKELKNENISKEELVKIRKKRYIIEAIIIAAVALLALIVLCNRTFLKVNYKTDKVNIAIPRFSYFVSDDDNEVKFITLRKSDYLKEYYNEYLEGFTFYSCASGDNTFYYHEQTKTLIKEIEVEKKFTIKVIEISYDERTPEEVCGLR